MSDNDYEEDNENDLESPLDGSFLAVADEQTVPVSLRCNVCLKTYTRKDNLKRHVDMKHSEKNRYMCSRCTQCFDDEKTMDAHMQDKHSTKRHLCIKCGKMFMKKSTLDEHIIVHGDEPAGKAKYVCPFDRCNKVFYRKQVYNDHIYSTHTGVKPYECRHCQQRFSQLYSCRRHEQKCSGEKDFKCDICGSDFCNLSNLKRHQDAIHRGIIHKCDFGRTYRYATNLDRHRKRHNH